MRGSMQQQPQINDQNLQNSQINNNSQQQTNTQQKQADRSDMTPEEQEASLTCKSVINYLILPYTCCTYPQPRVHGTKAEICKTECEKSTDPLCFNLCLNKNLKLFNENKTMQIDGWVEIFIAGFYDECGSKDAWMEILKNSAKKCSEKLLSEEDKRFSVDLLQLMGYGQRCMFVENFLACPNPSDREMCKKTFDFFTEENGCFKKVGQFIQVGTFWMRKKIKY
ncbi:hypothetical protein PVAND_016719 [Polypedilum vanderplanki]|uniref:Uncharacterized protein n=1 Tax=Polypedilum vanderplanki TaxID=319348 RepID=A0A9J6BFY4_POLVA|nr:hypothetical protein PVAND_016719 [Polypedilum vanderplanki]